METKSINTKIIYFASNPLSFSPCSFRFEDMFAELEERQEELGIAAFGVSMTTLEEVFFA